MNKQEYTNQNQERIILRGSELPILLLGSTFINLKIVSNQVRSADFDIEFYQEITSNRKSPSRFFVGRDFSNQKSLTNLVSKSFDYRIELCECIPELDSGCSENELRNIITNFERNEPQVNPDFPGMQNYTTKRWAETVVTTPNFRVYRFELRPPFTEQFILQTHKISTATSLAHVVNRYIKFHNKNVPELIQAETERVLSKH